MILLLHVLPCFLWIICKCLYGYKNRYHQESKWFLVSHVFNVNNIFCTGSLFFRHLLSDLRTQFGQVSGLEVLNFHHTVKSLKLEVISVVFL